MNKMKRTAILTGLMLFALPFLLFGYYSYTELISKQELQLRRGFEHSADYIQYNLDSAVHEVKLHLIFIGKNPVLQSILTGKVQNNTQIPLLLSNNIEPYIWYHITSTRSMMKNITIYSKTPYSVGNFLRAERDILPLLPPEFRQTNNPGGLAMVGDQLCYVHRIYGDTRDKELGLIVGEVDVDKLVSANIHEGREIGFSVALHDTVINQNMPAVEGQPIVVQKESEQTGLLLSLHIPSRHIKLETQSIVIASLISLVLLTLVYLGLLWRVRTLEKKVEEERIKWEKIRLKALQAQMNPHFLYNTLSMINWQAKYSDTPAISRITTLISAFYRTALNRGRDDILLKEEMDNVRSYLELKHIMMDGIFTYEVHCEEALGDHRIVNFILQPIAENALVHGIAPRGHGHVAITARAEGEDIVIAVRDDGEGMQGKTALSSPAETEGYGIRNIDERIKLLCGPQYGVHILPSERGTHVEIRVRQPLS